MALYDSQEDDWLAHQDRLEADQQRDEWHEYQERRRRTRDLTLLILVTVFLVGVCTIPFFLAHDHPGYTTILQPSK